MTDHFAGHHHHHIADLLEAHHSHHGHGGKKWTDVVPAPRCHANHAALTGQPSKHVRNTIEHILANTKGTPEQRQAARNWAELHKLQLTETALSSPIHSFYG